MKYDKTILVICIIVALAFGGWYGGLWHSLYYKFYGYKPSRIPLLEYDASNKWIWRYDIATPTNFAPPGVLDAKGEWDVSGLVYAKRFAVLRFPGTITTSEYPGIRRRAYGAPQEVAGKMYLPAFIGVDAGRFWFYDTALIHRIRPMAFDGEFVTTQEELETFGIAIVKTKATYSHEAVFRVHDVRNQPMQTVFDFMEKHGVTNHWIDFFAEPFFDGDLHPFFYDYYRAHYGEDEFVATTNRIDMEKRGLIDDGTVRIPYGG